MIERREVALTGQIGIEPQIGPRAEIGVRMVAPPFAIDHVMAQRKAMEQLVDLAIGAAIIDRIE